MQHDLDRQVAYLTTTVTAHSYQAVPPCRSVRCHTEKMSGNMRVMRHERRLNVQMSLNSMTHFIYCPSPMLVLAAVHPVDSITGVSAAQSKIVCNTCWFTPDEILMPISSTVALAPFCSASSDHTRRANCISVGWVVCKHLVIRADKS